LNNISTTSNAILKSKLVWFLMFIGACYIYSATTSPQRFFGVSIFTLPGGYFNSAFQSAAQSKFSLGTPATNARLELKKIGFFCVNHAGKRLGFYCFCFRKSVLFHNTWEIDITTDTNNRVKKVEATLWPRWTKVKSSTAHWCHRPPLF